MANIHKNLLSLIGNTPLMEVENISREEKLKARVIVKIESKNPGGSVKDRIALAMLENAEKEGLIKAGGTIIEPTSGNTGIGLAWVATVKGYKLILTMPETMSAERMKLLKALGATLVLTPGNEGMAGAVAKAHELNNETPGSIILGQFDNPSNPEAHIRTTAEEIWRDTDGKVDLFVACVGTGGTLSGTAQGLKRHNPHIKIIAVEPLSSPLLSGGKAGIHQIQGIGANFIPQNYCAEVVNEIMQVSDEEAMKTTRLLAKKEGLLVGISSGAAFHAALQLARLPENEGKMIVVLLPDTGERYLSTELFQ